MLDSPFSLCSLMGSGLEGIACCLCSVAPRAQAGRVLGEVRGCRSSLLLRSGLGELCPCNNLNNYI